MTEQQRTDAPDATPYIDLTIPFTVLRTLAGEPRPLHEEKALGEALAWLVRYGLIVRFPGTEIGIEIAIPGAPLESVSAHVSAKDVAENPRTETLILDAVEKAVAAMMFAVDQRPPDPRPDDQPDTDRPPIAEDIEAASADAFTALEFAHRFGDRYPEATNEAIRRAAERD